MSVVQRLFGIASEPPRTEHVCLMGLDNSGRTAALYRWKEKKFVTTFPTIGFNVETIQTTKKCEFSMRDMGGGMKKSRSFRNFPFANVAAVVFFVDATDLSRREEALQLLRETLADETFCANHTVFAVALSKVDEDQKKKSSSRSKSKSDSSRITQGDIRDRLDNTTDDAEFHRQIPIFSCSAVTGQGFHEILQWLVENTREKKRKERCKGRNAKHENKTTSTTTTMTERLEEWLHREDETDEDFLAKLEKCTLERWDHYARLRVMYVLLQRHGRREGMKLVFSLIRNFVHFAPVAVLQQGEERDGVHPPTFHETLTYFWTHMVHYCMETQKETRHDAEKQEETNDDVPTDSFKELLAWNPSLVKSELFLEYYSQSVVDAAPARVSVVLPDIQPLPSLLTNVHAEESSADDEEGEWQQESTATASLSDEPLERQYAQEDVDFWTAVQAGRSPCMGHDARLRVIWCALTLGSERNMSTGRSLALEVLKEKMYETHFHLTECYFWIQMVCLLLAQEEGQESSFSFRTLVWRANKSGMPRLRDPALIYDYYSSHVLETDSAKKEFVMADKKPIPHFL